MNALVTTPMRPAPAPLSEVTPLDQQMEWLDVLRGNADQYVKLLRRIMDEVGTHCLIQYDRSGRSLIIGSRDGDFAARHARGAALVQHARDSGHMIDLMAAAEAERMIIERRSGDVRALALTIKRFLHVGGILFLTREGRLRQSEGMPAEWCRRGPGALPIENAVRAWLTIRRLPNMDQWAVRFVRMAGVHRDGLVILEKRS